MNYSLLFQNKIPTMLQPVIASAMQVKLMVGIIFFLVMVTDVPLPGVAGRQGTAWF